MKSNYFVGFPIDFNENFEARDNCLDVWKDILCYSANLNGNWTKSRLVFYKSVVPTAQKHPAKFARWVNALVKASGIKIKSRGGFLRALVYLRKLQKKADANSVQQVLFSLFEAGLNEPSYAIKAIKNGYSDSKPFQVEYKHS